MNYSLGLMLCEEIMKELEDRFDLEVIHKNDTQHIKNVYKQMTNIKGNIGTLMKDEKNYAHRANKEQLNDGLYKLHAIVLVSDLWFDKCQKLIRILYEWQVVNRMIEHIESHPSLDPARKASTMESYKVTYGRLFETLDYGEDELITLISSLPHLSKIYSGSHTIVKSIGAMLT